MKSSKALFGVVLAVVISAKCQAQVSNIVTFNITAYVQNVSNDNGTTLTTLPAVQKRATTKDILTYLDNDFGSFPPGAQLVLVSTSSRSGTFVVTDRQFNVLADVSSVLTFSTGTNLVSSGKTSDLTGLAPGVKGMQLAIIRFDDTQLSWGEDLQFSMQGLLKGAMSQTEFGNNYTQAQSAIMVNGSGEGTYQGIPLVLSGSFSLRGKGIF